MPTEATIRCPACGKVNHGLTVVADSPATSQCTRCQADLEPLLRIQQAATRQQGQLLHQLSLGQLGQARATFSLWQALSPEAAQAAAPLRRLLG